MNIVCRRRRIRVKSAVLLVVIGPVLLVAGCATEPMSRLGKPQFTLPARFDQTGTAPLQNKWWRTFDDPGLNHLITQALSGNFSLQAAYARVKQAHATLEAAEAGLFPTIGATIDQNATHRNGNGNSVRSFLSSGGTTSGGTNGNATNVQPFLTNLGNNQGRDNWQYNRTARLTANYELDLWGRLRDQKKAAALGERAQKQALQDAAMTTSSDIANSWYKLQELRARIRLLKHQIKTNKNILELTTYSFRNGQSGAADVLRQRETVASVRGQLIQARAERDVEENALAILVGESPETFDPPAGKLVALPPLPATGIPSNLLMRRPDVRQNYLAIAADNQRVAAALADRYPQVSLSAVYSASSDIGSVLTHWLLQLTASVSQTIFDGGARSAKVAQQRAVVSEDVANYQQSMLKALQQVENALINESHQKRYLDKLDKQLVLSRKTVANLRLRYLRGATDYFNVLDAVLDRQNLQLNRLTGRYNLLQYRINLLRALAGGLENTPLGRGPEKSAATGKCPGTNPDQTSEQNPGKARAS